MRELEISVLECQVVEVVTDIFLDSLIDTIRLLPFLFLTYLLIEFIEHKESKKAESAIRKAGYAGPALGALLGVIPQCGFSAAAATLYATRVVTLGTLFAVFLATSDEMLPVLIAEQADLALIAQILLVKFILGMITGFVIDGVIRLTRRRLPESDSVASSSDENASDNIQEEDEGIFLSALKHTAQVLFFILLITLAINAIISAVGENTLARFLSDQPFFSVCASATIGLIPNCAASVVITELFLNGTLSTAAMISGLLVSAGVGLLVLFRINRPFKDNLKITALLWLVGVAWGILFIVLGISF